MGFLKKISEPQHTYLIINELHQHGAFNPDTVQDNAVIGNNRALSTGIEMVWVNGEIVYKNGKVEGDLPGKLLER